MDPISGRADEPGRRANVPGVGDLSFPGTDDGTAALPQVSRRPRDAPQALGGVHPVEGPQTGRLEPGGAAARVVQVVAGDHLLTINPVDGTEVVTCPPAERRTPVRRSGTERDERQAAARRVPPPGPQAPELPLLERDEEREQLVRLLARGRSVRVTGPSGSGRTTLLDAVADACAGLAPHGVIRLSGYHRTAGDLLQDLFASVYRPDGYRPDRPRLRELLRTVGAVVVVDDVELGGAALEDVLATAPECAFLMSATPDVPAPSSSSAVEGTFLSGLSRLGCMELLRLAVQRPLEEAETAWAADLWFESEGLPLRFVQAGALLRQRDALRPATGSSDWDDSVWEPATPALPPGTPTGGDPDVVAEQAHLPSLAESAAPAALLAAGLSETARQTLAFAVALGGECPHQAHLPALIGDTHGDAALGEIAAVGLALPVAGHYRLAAGVRRQLAAGFCADAEGGPQSPAAARHYAWWAGHPSIAPERVSAEAEAIIAAMAACRDGGHPGVAVLLGRTAGPVFAAALHWGAWERVLRIGQEAARATGEVAEEAYFHHELGVLALATGNLDRARAELEASIALRGALADRQGTLVGRRTLALVNDRSGDGTPLDGAAVPGTGPRTLADGPGLPLLSPSGASKAAVPGAEETPATIIGRRLAAAEASSSRRLPLVGSRRNLVAVGAGVLLAGLLGTIVTVGAGSGETDNRTVPDNVGSVETAAVDDPATDGPPAETPTAPASTPKSTGPSSSASASAGTRTAAPGSPPGTTSPSPTRPGGSTGAPPSGPAPKPPVPSSSASSSSSPSSSPTSSSSPSPTVTPTTTATTAGGLSPVAS